MIRMQASAKGRSLQGLNYLVTVVQQQARLQTRFHSNTRPSSSRDIIVHRSLLVVKGNL
jgi:hypothetical protein